MADGGEDLQRFRARVQEQLEIRELKLRAIRQEIAELEQILQNSDSKGIWQRGDVRDISQAQKRRSELKVRIAELVKSEVEAAAEVGKARERLDLADAELEEM